MADLRRRTRPTLGGLGWGGNLFLAMWVVYLHYQITHPDFWCPWDDGLPQTTRMVNAFVPTIGVFCAVLFLIPVFQQAREKALAARQKVEARRERGIIAPYAPLR